jgi:hypothetical protein
MLLVRNRAEISCLVVMQVTRISMLGTSIFVEILTDAYEFFVLDLIDKIHIKFIAS